MRFKSVGVTDSMPERIHVTQQIELRKKQQNEADQKAKAEKPSKDSSSQN
jgi:hypothetical protein